jgi:ubiquitin related modifier 1
MFSALFPLYPLLITYSGGLEMLFSNQRTHKLSLPGAADDDGGASEASPATIAFLVQYLCDHVMTDTRKEMFLLDGHV